MLIYWVTNITSTLNGTNEHCLRETKRDTSIPDRK